MEGLGDRAANGLDLRVFSTAVNTLAFRLRPLYDRDDDPADIQRAKDGLVAPCEPLGKIDIEVRISVRGVLGRDRREWATPRVEEKHDDLAADDSS